MNNETPTPGSWNVHTDDNGKHSVIGFGPLAHLGDSPRALANARLMAAAPDLLSTLEDLTSWVDAIQHTLGATNRRELAAQTASARRAINKARDKQSRKAETREQ